MGEYLVIGKGLMGAGVMALAPTRDRAERVARNMRQGGIYAAIKGPVPVGAHYRCPACGGSGCDHCSGIGYVTRKRALPVEVEYVQKALENGRKWEVCE